LDPLFRAKTGEPCSMSEAEKYVFGKLSNGPLKKIKAKPIKIRFITINSCLASNLKINLRVCVCNLNPKI
jgi:hypothetical protein